MAVEVTRRRFTVHEYHRMAEAGILAEDDRVELIEGEIVEVAAIGRLHAATVDRLTALLVAAVGRRANVRVQNPVRLSAYSEVQPDVARAALARRLLRGRPSGASRHTAGDRGR
jgi:Uma2 family endonuclease